MPQGQIQKATGKKYILCLVLYLTLLIHLIYIWYILQQTERQIEIGSRSLLTIPTIPIQPKDTQTIHILCRRGNGHFTEHLMGCYIFASSVGNWLTDGFRSMRSIRSIQCKLTCFSFHFRSLIQHSPNSTQHSIVAMQRKATKATQC